MRLAVTHDDPSAIDYGPDFVAHLAARAKDDRFRVYELVETPEAADAVLIVSRGDDASTNLRRHPLVRNCYEKCYVWDVRDNPIPFLPGLYASLPASRFDPRRHRAAGYVAPINECVAAVAAENLTADLFCTFVGGPTHWTRRALFAANPFGPRPDVIVRDVYGWAARTGDATDRAAKFRSYAELTARSEFVLCPRGLGTASHRLFEVMELGRVPVILADAWVPPAGPDWAAFSVRVPEADWAKLPQILESLRPNAAVMGKAARAAWDDWFSPAAQFHRVAGWVAELAAGRPHGRWDKLFWAAPAAGRKARVAARKWLRR